MKKRFLLSLALIALLTGACRTVDDSKVTASAIVKPEIITGSAVLSSALSEILYLQLLNIETASGIKVPSKNLHTSRGLLQCHSDGILKTCYVRARLVDNALSARESAESDIVRAFWTHTAQTRPSVINEPLLVADAVCDYIGPKSPPFNMEKVTCRIEHVRHANEVVLAGKEAAEIAETIRGDQVTTQEAKTSLTGTMLCRQFEGAGPACLTRGYESEALSSDIREIDTTVARHLHTAVVQMHRDHAMLTTTGRRVTYSRPLEVMTKIRCTIDLSQPQFYGGYICRMRL
jgi:hypothetical protein